MCDGDVPIAVGINASAVMVELPETPDLRGAMLDFA
jgi:hypothetical protein